MTSTGGRKRSFVRALLLGAVLLSAAGLLYELDPADVRGMRALREALTERGRVVVDGFADAGAARAPGSTWLQAASLPAVARALHGTDAAALLRALADNHIAALLIKPGAMGASDSVRDRLGRYQPVDGLRGLQLSPAMALYAPEPLETLPKAERHALAVVARRIVGGARPPQLASFPENLRRVRPVEVMVLLRQGEQARLWRSARGSSVARALLTASEVARERWHEREQAMGGPLDPLLPTMQVEVSLLIDDGTIALRDPTFIDRAFFKQHGVGYERKGAWRYLLPDATAEHKRPSDAYRKLFADDGLPADSFDRHELRLYRLRVYTLAVSPRERAKDDGLTPLRTPDELFRPEPAPHADAAVAH